ncbi:lipid-transfer protein [Striga asiatica]|uniref:Lipid-transfer protein n=1 Tax=Striga asiatica TaxID=4170 RepID=A0A5A7PYA3_STRAF|nr:lipid-transfer protein [Striga asiatica]
MENDSFTLKSRARRNLSRMTSLLSSLKRGTPQIDTSSGCLEGSEVDPSLKSSRAFSSGWDRSEILLLSSLKEANDSGALSFSAVCFSFSGNTTSLGSIFGDSDSCGTARAAASGWETAAAETVTSSAASGGSGGGGSRGVSFSTTVTASFSLSSTTGGGESCCRSSGTEARGGSGRDSGSTDGGGGSSLKGSGSWSGGPSVCSTEAGGWGCVDAAELWTETKTKIEREDHADSEVSRVYG